MPPPSSSSVERFRGGVLGKHGFKIHDFAQLHRAFVERVGPFDDRVKGDRAFAQPQDHRIAARFDALGDRDFAFAAEQFHRAHFAQVHADGIIGAVDRFFLFFNNSRAAQRVSRVDGFDFFLGLGFFAVIGGIVIFDDVARPYR